MSARGTNWSFNDPEIEPLVEIYQGSRNSYEHADALKAPPAGDLYDPKVHTPGSIANMLSKNYRIGFAAGSGPGSNGVAFTAVYATGLSRAAIFDALRQRRAYAATDKILLDVRFDDHLMGETYSTASDPRIRIVVKGTSAIRQVDIIRNNQVIYSRPGGATEHVLQIVDNDIREGANCYYVRVIQDDEAMAWSSPVWINFVSGL